MALEGVFLDERRMALEKARGIWPDRVITDYLDRWVAEKPGETAIVAFRDEDATTTQMSWRELGLRAGAIAAALAARGVAKGDVVSFQLPNWWEFVAMHLACVRIGAVSNPLMPIFRRRELSFMIGHAESKVLVAPERFRGFDHGSFARELKREIGSLEHVFLVGGRGDDSFDSLLARPGDFFYKSGSPLAANDVVQLLYTSGTTGEPKGTLHTSNTLIGTTVTFTVRMGFGRRDVIFMPSPLAHQAGFTYGLVASLVLGVPLLLVDAWNPARAVELMEKYRATYTFAATPFLSDLANYPEVEKRSLEAFRLFVTSGAPIPPVLVELAHRRLRSTAVVAGWGMTECGIASATPLSGYKVLESDGAALPGEELRIVDDEGREAPRGQAGALKFRGASLFVGYLKRPKLYDVDAEGWFETGDIARMDEEGYIRICGRRKDIIIRGGENIPVVEVESALYKMAEVADAAVVAMPDPRLSERACAFVTLRRGQRLALENMRAFLAAQGLAKQFWPERLEVIDVMPRTPTGKIQKYVLREMAKRFAAQPSANQR